MQKNVNGMRKDGNGISVRVLVFYKSIPIIFFFDLKVQLIKLFIITDILKGHFFALWSRFFSHLSLGELVQKS